MKNTYESPAAGGGAGPDTPQTSLPSTGNLAAGIPDSTVWDPPAYLTLLGQGLAACGLPPSVPSAAAAARELRALTLTSADSGGMEILKGQVHLLNGVFAKLIEAGIPKPAENLGLIVAALKAQELCNITIANLRLEKELEVRREKFHGQHDTAAEKNRLTRIRLSLNQPNC